MKIIFWPCHNYYNYPIACYFKGVNSSIFIPWDEDKTLIGTLLYISIIDNLRVQCNPEIREKK